MIELSRDNTVEAIISRLGGTQSDGDRVLKVSGTWGSFAPMLAVHIQQKLQRPVVYLCPHIDDAEKAADDLSTFLGRRVQTFSAWEGQLDLPDATDEIRSERLRISIKISESSENFLVAAGVQAICQPIPKMGVVSKNSLRLEVNQKVSPEAIASWLVDNSFENVEKVDLPGQFAKRGGIVDIFSPLLKYSIAKGNGAAGRQTADGEGAVRVEFFGDQIESIRSINLDSQRSTADYQGIEVVSTVCGRDADQQEMFIDILPKDAIILLDEPGDIQDVAQVYLERVEDRTQLYSWDKIHTAISRFTVIQLSKFAIGNPDEYLHLNIKSVEQFQRQGASLWAEHKQSLEALAERAAAGSDVYFYCETAAELKRIEEIIKQSHHHVSEHFKLAVGFINKGFCIESLNAIVISHHEVFGQYTVRRRQRPLRASMPIDTLEDLNVGDYVVHISYGIGKYLGVRTIAKEAGAGEFLTIEYADKAKIHVSAANINLVQKYIGTSPKRPQLSKLGSKKWERQKQKAAESVNELAAVLLENQAKRQAMGGIAYEADGQWQLEFEESFSYQETADQLTAIEQIKGDMQEAIAMDRLLCGDVGYGKTEVAMRAAFKSVMGGKQVAVLVPTTVLSVQHHRTFTERFADFPVSIEVLNRFRTAREARDIVSRAKEARVDIVIGTHRLLSGDVGFADLGLLIIDEEQRFGVEAKEKLKRLRVNVDVLTMTATPIPRTLHMAMLGLRDISSLGTPPLDRRSVVTQVTSYNDELIRKAILLELNRQGQVFFLHNRVQSIERKAADIRKLIGDTGARIAIAHGQMTKHQLEKSMVDFVLGKIDVLVCTTIIESGLDIPNANTIFIDNADRFGLAELHQLRGRVGRYKHRAYAYMLLPKSRTVTPIAAKRLKAIEEYSHLGAGFRIALRDLEIRGAGNILGSEQSGHIQMVGYQMYCELLSEAVRKLKNQPLQVLPTAEIDLGFAVYIPKNYIPNDRSRMELYRKIASARRLDDVKQTADEAKDLYGPIPKELRELLELAELKVMAAAKGVRNISVLGQKLTFVFGRDVKAEDKNMFADIRAKLTAGDTKTFYLHLPQNYFQPATLMRVLRKILRGRTK